MLVCVYVCVFGTFFCKGCICMHMLFHGKIKNVYQVFKDV